MIIIIITKTIILIIIKMKKSKKLDMIDIHIYRDYDMIYCKVI